MHAKRILKVAIMSMMGLGAISAPAQSPSSRVLIRATKPYALLSSQISSLGGRVLYQYQYVGAIAAELRH